tara:strand:- start:145 stop:390 length:246 start_codon:yes stop_codon:yes gene_type:complete
MKIYEHNYEDDLGNENYRLVEGEEHNNIINEIKDEYRKPEYYSNKYGTGRLITCKIIDEKLVIDIELKNHPPFGKYRVELW